MFINLRHFPSKLSVLKLAFVLKMLEVLTFILNLIFKICILKKVKYEVGNFKIIVNYKLKVKNPN